MLRNRRKTSPRYIVWDSTAWRDTRVRRTEHVRIYRMEDASFTLHFALAEMIVLNSAICDSLIPVLGKNENLLSVLANTKRRAGSCIFLKSSPLLSTSLAVLPNL